MKVFFVLGLVLAFVGCATEEQKKPMEEVSTQQVEKPKKVKKVKAPTMETTTEAAAPSSGGALVVCNNDSGSDERRIEVVSVGSGCAVKYTKQGSENEVAKATVDSSYCENVKTKIENNLTGAGFKCSAQ